MRRFLSVTISGLLCGSLIGALSACATKVVHEEAAKAPTNDIEAEQSLKDWQQTRQKTYFDWPVDDARMTRGFLPNRKHPHKGVDLAAKKNTPILASHDGTVIYVGHGFHGFGKMVMIEGDKGWATLYAHLNTIKVREGQKVKQGEIIAAMGRTGHATGFHLHFEIRKITGPVDPLIYLPGGSRLANNH